MFLTFSVFLSARPVNKKSFLQHVEDLCATDNAKFQEEFAVSVCLQAGPVFIKLLRTCKYLNGDEII